MNERKSKNIVIIALCVTLIFMGVGFSALSQQLTITGTATVSGEWNVQVTEIKAVEVYDNSVATPAASTDTAAIQAYLAKNENNSTDMSTTSATFNVDLAQPGDYIVYEVTVENKGNINAKLGSLVAGVTGTDSEAIDYTLEGITEGATLDAGATNTYRVKVAYDVNSIGANAPDLANGSLTETFTVTAVYNQAQ